MQNIDETRSPEQLSGAAAEELDALRPLYNDYIASAALTDRNRGPLEGLWNASAIASTDLCHERFVRDAKERLDAFEKTAPSSRDTRAVLEYVYAAPAENRSCLSSYWTLSAVHGLTMDLIRRLTPEDALMLSIQYEKYFPVHDRLPIQEQVFTALKARSFS